MSDQIEANPYTVPSARLDEVEMQGDADAGPILASRWSRLGATVIDYLVVTGPTLLAFAYGRYGSGTLDLNDLSSFGLGVALSMLFGAAMLVFNLFLLRFNGQTIGKKLLGIKLVRSDGHSYVSLWRIIGLRFAPLYLAGRWFPVIGQAVWGIDALSIFGPERKCIHDYLADTIVITENGAASADKRVAAASEGDPFDGQLECDTLADDELNGKPLIVVATVDGPVEAAFARGLLEEQQIASRLEFDPVQSSDPILGASSSGGAKLLVAASQLEAAVEVLTQGLNEADGEFLEYDWDEESLDESDDSH